MPLYDSFDNDYKSLCVIDFATLRQRKIVTKTQTTYHIVSLVRGVGSFSNQYTIICFFVLWKQKSFGHKSFVISLSKHVSLIRQNTPFSWRLSATLNYRHIRSMNTTYTFRWNRILSITMFHVYLLAADAKALSYCLIFSLHQYQPGFVKILIKLIKSKFFTTNKETLSKC